MYVLSRGLHRKRMIMRIADQRRALLSKRADVLYYIIYYICMGSHTYTAAYS